MIDIVCQRPAAFSYLQELWTLKNLHQHIQNNEEVAGYPRLKTITRSILRKILKRTEIKIEYYYKKCVLDFENKMHDVLRFPCILIKKKELWLRVVIMNINVLERCR